MRAQKLARGNPGLQDLASNKLVLRPDVPLKQAEVALKNLAAQLEGSAPEAIEDEEVRVYLKNLALKDLFTQVDSASQALLRAMSLFRIPVPETVAQHLATEIGGNPTHLRDLGLLEPFEDLVEPVVTALAVNALATVRIPALRAEEEQTLASLVLPRLLAAWGGMKGAAWFSIVTNVELTRLGLLAGNADIVEAFADIAVISLVDGNRCEEAGQLGQEALALLEGVGRISPLNLIAGTSMALSRNGEGEALARVLSKGTARLEGTQMSSLEPDELTRFLLMFGCHQVTTGKLDAARATFEQVGAFERVRGNKDFLALAQTMIAHIVYRRGEPKESLRILQDDVLPVFQRLGELNQIANTYGKIAGLLQDFGFLKEALRIRCEEQLPVYIRLGKMHSIAVTKSSVADILIKYGETNKALQILRDEVLPVHQRMGEVRLTALTKCEIAEILLKNGELEETLRILRDEALPVFQGLGDLLSTTTTQGQIADVLQKRGEQEEALRILRDEVLPILRNLGDLREVAVVQIKIAQNLVQNGHLTEALTRGTEGLAICRALSNADGIGSALWTIAQIKIEQDDYASALLHLAEAWPLLLQTGRLEAIAIVGEALGQLLAVDGRKDEALLVLRQSAAAHRKLGHDIIAQEVDQLITHLSLKNPLRTGLRWLMSSFRSAAKG